MPALRASWIVLSILLLCTSMAAGDFRAGKQAYDAGRYDEAIDHWQAAGKSGDLDAIYQLGKMYGEGFGVLEDPVRAYALFSVAAAKGHKDSLTARQIIREEMTVDERGRARQLAAKFLETYFSPPAKQSESGLTNANIVVAGAVRLVRDSDTDILNLSNNWLQLNARAIEGHLPAGRQWQFVETYRYPRRDEDKTKLCEQHNAYGIFGTRLRAETPDHNQRREHSLVWFDCRKRVEKSARMQARKQSGTWNIDSTIARFARSLKLEN